MSSGIEVFNQIVSSDPESIPRLFSKTPIRLMTKRLFAGKDVETCRCYVDRCYVYVEYSEFRVLSRPYSQVRYFKEVLMPINISIPPLS